MPTSRTYRWGSKTGSNRSVINDVGFVESPVGTMVIALYSLKLGDRVTGECALSEIARAAMQVTGMISVRRQEV